LLAKPSPLNINLGSDRFSMFNKKAGHPPFIFWIRIYPSVRAWKYKARGIPAGLVQLRPEKMRPVQETRQDPTHPHSVVSQDDERNRSKSGSSSQRATRLSSRVALGLIPSSGKRVNGAACRAGAFGAGRFDSLAVDRPRIGHREAIRRHRLSS
jgi:hypothetical protein